MWTHEFSFRENVGACMRWDLMSREIHYRYSSSITAQLHRATRHTHRYTPSPSIMWAYIEYLYAYLVAHILRMMQIVMRAQLKTECEDKVSVVFPSRTFAPNIAQKIKQSSPNHQNNKIRISSYQTFIKAMCPIQWSLIFLIWWVSFSISIYISYDRLSNNFKVLLSIICMNYNEFVNVHSLHKSNELYKLLHRTKIKSVEQKQEKTLFNELISCQ